MVVKVRGGKVTRPGGRTLVGVETSGVAVGCGWQQFVAYVNVGCYYIVGVPLGVLLGFVFNFGVKVMDLSVNSKSI